MTTQPRHAIGLGLLLLAAIGGEAQAATLPATTCTSTGATTRTCDLWARPGTLPLPGGATAAVWGYSDSDTGAATVPGPTLIVNQGETVTVNLTNGLPEATALLFQGQALPPDLAGAAASGGTRSYTFVASAPGTYLYEAGLLSNAQHQTAMGLYGAVIVRPTSDGTATGTPILTQAYPDTTTTFDDEALLVLGEVDPALSASPATFDMRNYAPRYFLINGKAYPDTEPVPSAAGRKVLLRYLNAGIQHHSMALLGLRQNFVAKDASLLPEATHDVVAEALAPGQTGDAIVQVPASVTTESRFALYDGNLMLHNNGTAGFGGMLTFVTAGTGTVTTGPVTTGVSAAPSPTNGSVNVLLTATVASTSSTVSAAEYFVDTPGLPGTGTAMSGTFGGPSATVSATLDTTLLAGLTSGIHSLYVRGQDAGGNWGAPSSAVLNLDKAGPVTSGLTLTPNPSNGTVSVALHATGDDSTTGGANVVAAEYFVGAVGANGSGTAMAVNAIAPIVSLDATIAPPVTGGVVSVHGQDAQGNWGAFATITLDVVTGGPVTTGVSAAPNPNNGAVPLNSSSPVVRVTATMTSTGSTVSAAEGFIDVVGANGTGFAFVASDGTWNGASETAYADVPLTTIAQLSSGDHAIHVHGKDAAGNWGGTATTVLVIDKAAPTIGGVTLSPSTMVFGTASISMTVTASDAGTGVTGGQYWIDGTATPPANATAFAGSSATIPTGTLAGGIHTVYVRVRDAAGNWSAVSSTTLTVIRAVNDARSITANTSATQNSDATTAQSVLANDEPVGLAGRTAALASAPVRTSGTGLGTITVTCPGTLGTAATPAIGGNTICTNGRYRVTLSGVGGSGNARRSSKLGTYQFTYSEIVNGVSAQATVTITVN